MNEGKIVIDAAHNKTASVNMTLAAFIMILCCISSVGFTNNFREDTTLDWVSNEPIGGQRGFYVSRRHRRDEGVYAWRRQ